MQVRRVEVVKVSSSLGLVQSLKAAIDSSLKAFCRHGLTVTRLICRSLSEWSVFTCLLRARFARTGWIWGHLAEMASLKRFVVRADHGGEEDQRKKIHVQHLDPFSKDEAETISSEGRALRWQAAHGFIGNVVWIWRSIWLPIVSVVLELICRVNLIPTSWCLTSWRIFTRSQIKCHTAPTEK